MYTPNLWVKFVSPTTLNESSILSDEREKKPSVPWAIPVCVCLSVGECVDSETVGLWKSK